MPRSGKQKKLDEFYSKSSSPPKSTPVKKQKKEKSKPRTSSPGLFAIKVDENSDDSDIGHFRLEPSSSQAVPNELSDDDEPVQLLSPVARRRRQVENTQVVSEENSSSSDDNVPLYPTPKRKRKVVDLDSDDDQEDNVKSKKRRVLKRGLKPTAEEENVLDELDKDVVIEQRLRKPPKKTAYQKNLERLKRQRQGLPELPSSDSQSSEEESENEIIELDSDGEEKTRYKPIPGARKGPQSSSPINLDSSSDDVENFIVDDEEEADGGISLPMQFSMTKAQPLGASFKVFFQLLVHVACQPNHLRVTYMKARLNGSNDTAEYFKHARNQLERQLGHIRDSQVASSIWDADFRKSLTTHPELKIATIESENYCHACRKISAISTRQAHLSGVEYNRDGYEPLDASSESSEEEEDSEESDSEDNSESSSESSEESQENTDQSEKEEEEKIVYNLGQHCARRVALFHAFTHWELALFHVIEEKVIAVETRNREKLRKKKKKKKRLVDTADPDNILDWLEKKGIISHQWQAIQQLMERAKHVEKRFAHEID